jgi:hypothetical protein
LQASGPPIERLPREMVAGWRVERHAYWRAKTARAAFALVMAYEASMTPVHLPAVNLVREAGVEPAASRLSVECSNHAELFPVVLRTQRVEPRARFELAFPDYRFGASPTMLTGPANSGANGANRTLIGCLPCNFSPVELHRLGAKGGSRNPDLHVTNAVLFS